ncbi:hypothetical protein ACE10Z_41360 [Bradyrhizobium sp. Pha-3]|uniref:hypothetical protein n=1 Tax=Bradyrhizobium sp. Pha-3 TaxID=208375 RepID=UPI0035D4C2B8
MSDLLLRWLQPFYANLESTYLFENTVLFTPDLLAKNWNEVRSELSHHVRFDPGSLEPGQVSAIVLSEVHSDVVCVSGLLALHWYATKQQPSETARTTGVLTLDRRIRASEGSLMIDTTSKTTFRLLWEFLIRYALNPRFAESRYSSTLDDLVRYLTNLASPRMVSGRVYGGFGIDGVDTLRPSLLGAMAANLPEEGDEGVSRTADQLKSYPVFENDETVRNFVSTMQQTGDYLADVQKSEAYERSVQAVKPDLDVSSATKRLCSVFVAVTNGFRDLRKERLRAASLDEGRMSVVRKHMTESLLSIGPWLSCFQYSLERQYEQAIWSELEFGTIDKGSFVIPEMSALSFDELPKLFSDSCRILSANLVWRAMNRRPKRVVAMDISKGTEEFWKAVIAKAPTVGPMPVLIASYHPFGAELFAAIHRRPGEVREDYDIVHERNLPSGGGLGYQGTIEGVRVYCGPHISPSRAYLCSSQLIRRIRYSVVREDGDLADFRFLDGEDLFASRVRVKLAQDIDWSDHVFVEFRIGEERKLRKRSRLELRRSARRLSFEESPEARKGTAGRKRHLAIRKACFCPGKSHRPKPPVAKRFGRPTRSRRIQKL